MPREPQGPRWRNDRQVYVVQIDGRQHTLGRTKKEANKRFRELMDQRDNGQSLHQITVKDLVNRYLSHQKQRIERNEIDKTSNRWRLTRVGLFGEDFSNRLVSHLKPYDVHQWVDRPTWGSRTRSDTIGALVTLFRWGVRQGLSSRNPIEWIERPSAKRTRPVMDGQQARMILENIQRIEVYRIVLFLLATGCRPSEACRIEAKDINWKESVVILSEHKTSKKTGRPRVIALSWIARLILRVQVAEWPEGPCFRNAWKQPWTPPALLEQVHKAARKAGIDQGAYSYAFRHVFATDLLRDTGDLVGVSALLGHADTAITSRIYSHVHEDYGHLRKLLDG